MILRSVAVRALEWRARWFSDPVDRLQFLRRNVPVPTKSRRRWRRVVENMPALVITLGVVAAAIGLFSTSTRHVRAAARPAVAAGANSTAGPTVMRAVAEPPGHIWLVKNTSQFDLYSNGLRIENQYATATALRRYLAFARSRVGVADWRTEPMGIVFHTTESHIAPFEEDQNQVLQRAGEGLLEYVNRTRAYHFVIDRFGRVFRVVRESDYANHAGNSVWADDSWIYINLNQSFFGVAFEAQSASAETSIPVTAAQVHAGRILTEMLRARYGIIAANCVTHAQVSVNPGNLRAGYHVDWAANLPFSELGLADNYQRPLPSVTLFGFQADAALIEKGGASLARGIDTAEAQVQRDAILQGQPVETYRKTLQKRYRDAIRALRGNAAPQEYN
jgi:N-acetylmuramoyl-L-alanine amidase